MQLPSVDDVNSHPAGAVRRPDHRRARVGAGRFFSDVVSHYVNEHDVPEADVAAALALVLQGDPR